MKIRFPALMVLLGTVVFAQTLRDETTTLHPESRSARRNIAAGLSIPFRPCPVDDDAGALYIARTPCGSATILEDGNIRYTQRNPGGAKSKTFIVEEEFLFAEIEIVARHPSPTSLHLFQGRDQRRWRKSVPTYETVEYEGAYEGIDIRLRALPNNIEKQFLLHPGARPEAIRVKVHGADRLTVNGLGELEAETPQGTVRFTRPVAFQETNRVKTYVDAAYAVEGNTYRFSVDAYDTKRPLVIDPLLASTFLGGEGEDTGYAVAMDGGGNVFVAGGTASSVFLSEFRDSTDWDVFVAKYDPDLTTLESLSLIGGSGDERAYDIVIDGDENVFVTGSSASQDFPTSPGAFSENPSGHYDAFILKMDNDLSALLASTTIGGEGFDGCYALALDENGDIYATGLTYSHDYPATAEAFDRSYTEVSPEWLPGDAFVSRLDNGLSDLRASTFLGAGGFDWGLDIVWHEGAVYIGGETKAPLPVPGSAGKPPAAMNPDLDPYVRRKMGIPEIPTAIPTDGSAYRETPVFPVTPGAFDPTHNGETDIFIARMDGGLESLETATLLGGRRTDLLGGIGFDRDDRLIVGGSTLSPDFPTTAFAYDTDYNGFFDAYIAKLDPSLSTLEAATLYGGSDSDVAEAFTVKGNGFIYLAGYTTSPDLPMPRDSYDSTHTEPGIADIFIARFDNDLAHNTAATLLGGLGHQDCSDIVNDRGHHFYITGTTRSTDFPVTPDAHRGLYGGGRSDAFVLKIDRYLSGEDNRFWDTQKLLFYPPYPNPFRTQTTIRIDLPNPTPLSVTIYDITGKHVWTFPTPGTWEPGLYDLYWGGECVHGDRVPAGPYICRIRTREFNETRKLVLLRE